MRSLEIATDLPLVAATGPAAGPDRADAPVKKQSRSTCTRSTHMSRLFSSSVAGSVAAVLIALASAAAHAQTAPTGAPSDPKAAQATRSMKPLTPQGPLATSTSPELKAAQPTNDAHHVDEATDAAGPARIEAGAERREPGYEEPRDASAPGRSTPASRLNSGAGRTAARRQEVRRAQGRLLILTACGK